MAPPAWVKKSGLCLIKPRCRAMEISLLVWHTQQCLNGLLVPMRGRETNAFFQLQPSPFCWNFCCIGKSKSGDHFQLWQFSAFYYAISNIYLRALIIIVPIIGVAADQPVFWRINVLNLSVFKDFVSNIVAFVGNPLGVIIFGQADA